MQPFISKDGRQIEPVDHFAKFNGKNNSCKGKTLLMLERLSNRWLTARQLHQYSGVSYEYLETRLPFWYNIRYVNRKPNKPAKGRPVWQYQIAERGRKFIYTRMPDDVRTTLIQEIDAWLLQQAKK